MSRDKRVSFSGERLVELTRVQPFEAELIAARLRSQGIDAVVGADSVYESVNFSEGVSILIPEHRVEEALAILQDDPTPDR